MTGPNATSKNPTEINDAANDIGSSDEMFGDSVRDDRPSRQGDHTNQGSGPKPPAVLSNKFESYLMMKQRQLEEKRPADRRSVDDLQNNDENKNEQESNLWTHFVAPLKPQLKSTAEETTTSPAKKIHHLQPSGPSMFTDLERSQTVDRFSKLFMKIMGDALSSEKVSRAWQGVDNSYKNNNHNDNILSTKMNSADYKAERNMIQPHLTPFVWGSSCMVITLFSMRFGRWYNGGKALRAAASTKQTLQSTWKSNQHAFSSSNNAKRDVTKLQDLRKSPFQLNNSSLSSNNNNNSGSPWDSLQSLPIDMALSLLVGASTTLFLSDTSKLLQDFSQAPLLEGKSLLSEELCIPFDKEMGKVNQMIHKYDVAKGEDGVRRKEIVSYKELWREDQLGEFESLRSIRDFVENCHRREMVAKKIVCQQKGGDRVSDDMADNFGEEQDWRKIKIPPPGISSSLAPHKCEPNMVNDEFSK